MNTPLRTISSWTLPAQDASILAELVRAANPFLKIHGADRVDWRRVIKNERDGRNGPWKWNAKFEVLDCDTWNRLGEVLYFVTDGEGTVKTVGQSSGRLKSRWKTVPMFATADAAPLNRYGLFHTTGWREIEAELDLGKHTTYTVSAIFRGELQRLCHTLGGPLAEALAMPETHTRKLSYHVETWVCTLKRHGLPLWNIQQTGLRQPRTSKTTGASSFSRM